ncbi:MAG TPA: nuclear transport factor 2 family protein [Ilumatobacteraceae bacterium]
MSAEMPETPATEPTAFAALTARLQRLEDLDAIRQLFIDYGRHLDRCDFAAYAALFADDGEVLLGPLGRAQGPDAIRALMERTLAGREGETYHVISSPVIELSGDTATSSVMWTVVARNSEGGTAVTMIGHHDDQLVRQRGQWRFARRRGFVDIPSTYRA